MSRDVPLSVWCISLSPLWGVPGRRHLADGYAPVLEPWLRTPGPCRYQPHLPEAIEDSPELWPRHKADGSMLVQEVLASFSGARSLFDVAPDVALKLSSHKRSEVIFYLT